MNIIEKWKPVDGYEGLYEVSNLGRVKSLSNNKSRKERILKPGKAKNGYLKVVLYRNGKCKTFKVHRLVAIAFLPNPEGLPEVNHKNEVKTNNCVNNIEWCDRKYNINYGSHNKRAASARINHPAFSKSIEASRFSDFREICLRFPSMREAGRKGYDYNYVSRCCRGCYCREGNFYKNLYWRYAV